MFSRPVVATYSHSPAAAAANPQLEFSEVRKKSDTPATTETSRTLHESRCQWNVSIRIDAPSAGSAPAMPAPKVADIHSNVRSSAVDGGASAPPSRAPRRIAEASISETIGWTIR